MLDHSTDPARAGESRSYEELYVEHAPAARRLALSMVPADVADDIVAEAFARVLAAIRAGGGPSHAFRGYLLTAVRHQAHDWLQARRRLTVVADLDVQAEDAVSPGRVNPGIGSAADTQVEARDEARLVTRAFGRLPARWREVLWQLEVEGKAPAAVAPMFGLSANGVSALAMRAREGLRQAYLEEHVGTNIPAACRTYAAEFGAGARGRLSQRRRAAMQEHLGQCPACQRLFTELTELNSRLGTILTPAALAAASSALRSAKHATIVRTSLTGHWRTWRWHPVTTVTGAAAGVVVAGGMLLAVNVTPVTSTPAHAATGPAVPAAAPSGSFARKRQPGGSGPGAGAATAATRSVTRSPAGPASLPGTGSPAAPPPEPITGARSGGSAPGAPAAGSSQASQAPSNGGTSAASTPANPLVNTAGATVTGVVNTAGTTVTGVTNAASGLVSTATTTVTGVTNAAAGAVTGITSTAGATVAAAGNTVSNAVSGVASTATSTVTAVASTATNTVTGAASTAASTVTAAASTVTGAATSTVTGAASAAAAPTNAVSTAPTMASTAAASTTAATATPTESALSSPASAVTPATTSTAQTAATAATNTANTVATATTGLLGAATGTL